MCWKTLLGMRLALRFSWYIQRHRDYHLQIASWSAVWLMPVSLSQCWNLSGLSLRRFWICCHSLSEFMWFSPAGSGRHGFLGITHHKSFCLLVHIDPWTLRGRVWWRHPMWDWVFQGLSVSGHCPAVGLCWFPSPARRCFSNECWVRHRSMGMATCRQGSFDWCVSLAEK
jgi:hypothetical protein